MALTVALIAFGISPAEAASTPAKPQGLKVSTGYSTAKITWSKAKYATKYRVCLRTNSTTKKCVRLSPKSTKRSVTFKKLKPTGGPDYFAVITAYNGNKSRSSSKKAFDLRSGSVNNLKPAAWTNSSLTIAWSAARNADGYLLQAATSADFTSGLKNVNTSKTSLRLTGLSSGRVYYFRVRSHNGKRLGAYTARSQRRLASNAININVVTYNLCGQDHCRDSADDVKKADGSFAINEWKTRKPNAAKLALLSKPDVIATQESGNDTDFGSALSGYALAKRKSAKSLFYNKTRYNLLHSGWVMLRDVPNSTVNRYAVWAELEDKATKTRLFAFGPHLTSGKGKENDVLREKETRVLIAAVDKYNPYGFPTVFAGDFNSNPDNANQSKYRGGYDAPTKVFAEHTIDDTKALAADKDETHANFNSYNGGAPVGERRSGQHLDRIFADNGRFAPQIAVSEWEVVVDLMTTDGETYVTPFASDHNPVRAKLTIPGFPASP